MSVTNTKVRTSLVILHDRSNEEEVVGFNVLAISAEELEVVISAENVLAENDLRALFQQLQAWKT